LETRQYETRQAQFGVRSVVVDLLPTTLRLVTRGAPTEAGAPVTRRHSQMFDDCRRRKSAAHDKSLFRSGRSGIGPGEGQITGAHSATKNRESAPLRTCGPSIAYVVQPEAENQRIAQALRAGANPQKYAST
jgi:hypothetical protein